MSNRIHLEDIRAMPVGEIAALPVGQLALLQEDAEAALTAAKTLKDWLDGAIGLRFGERAHAARRGTGKDTGTVRLVEDGVTVVADLPKRVEWDQSQARGRWSSVSAPRATIQPNTSTSLSRCPNANTPPGRAEFAIRLRRTRARCKHRQTRLQAEPGDEKEDAS